jgi:hypothetical protein
MSSRTTTFVATLVSLVLASLAAAQGSMQMPYYDVNSYCASESAAMGAGDMGVALCVDREQYDYNRLTSTWPQLDPMIQQTCIQKTPIASYSRLSSCVLNERSNQMLRAPSFQH